MRLIFLLAIFTICMNSINAQLPDPGSIFINEFDYNNDGPDDCEFVEIFAPANTDLTNFKIEITNSDGNVTQTVVITQSILNLCDDNSICDIPNSNSVIVPNMSNGYGAVSVCMPTFSNNGYSVRLLDINSLLIHEIIYGDVSNEGCNSGFLFDDFGEGSWQLIGSGDMYCDYGWEFRTLPSPAVLNGLQNVVPDLDNDGILDNSDNCPTFPNPNQINSDSDSLGDLCDNCPTISNINQINQDADNWGDLCDNCPTIPNNDQSDSDQNGTGDECQLPDIAIKVENGILNLTDGGGILLKGQDGNCYLIYIDENANLIHRLRPCPN